jgi:hypothetical protein
MKFIARQIDLKVELVQMDGKENTLSVPPLSAKQASALLDKLIAEDNTFDKAHKDKAAEIYVQMTEHYSGQLASIYNTDAAYWSDNFDGTTIAEVKKHIIDELLGVRKKS